MHQVKKGNQYHFGMKLHIGVDAVTGLVHSSTTPANVHDVTETHRLLHGGEARVWGDAGYVGAEAGGEPRVGGLAGGNETGAAAEAGAGEPGALAEVKASIRAKVEHPFLDVALRLRQGTLPGLAKNRERAGAAAGTVQSEKGPGRILAG